MGERLNQILWKRFKDGDDDALTSLFTTYAHSLFSYGIAIVADEALVKDSIQEVFIQLINRRKELIVSEQSHVYLFKSLRNKIFEELRTSKRKQAILNSIKRDYNSQEDAIENRIIASEENLHIKEKIERAFETLTSRQREAIFLRYTEALDYDEIASLLNIDIASARTLVYRALKSVKKEIGEESFPIFFLLMKKNTSAVSCS
ncbi:MAG: RNA polymerase sigma factor [Draconibacterium sp.]